MNSMVHWNGNHLCVIDTETTGLDPLVHEMWQICMLPLDSNIDPRTDVLPFYVEVKPQHPERIDWQSEVMRGNREKIAKACDRGLDLEKVRELLEEWIDKLGLPLNQSGFNRCKILPLGQNFAFDRAFLHTGFGRAWFDEYFHYHYRDTMIAANYLNDQAAFHARPAPYPKISLTYLASQLKIPNERSHDAFEDCIKCARVYKRMVMEGLL